MRTFLDFEKPVSDLEGQIQELKRIAEESEDSASTGEEVAGLEAKAREQLRSLYGRLTPWQKTQVARHPDRPHASHYIAKLINEFTLLCGDRKYGDDKAVLAGIGRFQGRPVAILAQEKGADTQSRLDHNFGMARPEGYRKAVRIMDLADRYAMPVISFVDTAGAYPGVGAEERGQAEAIARCTEKCLSLGVPNVAVVIGEGGSGGAIALATTNAVLMLEHAIYSVISPEGAASILWRDSARAQDAATAMKITAADMKGFKIVDAVIKEPLGGAHRKPDEAIDAVGDALENALSSLSGLSPEKLRAQRREKFLKIGGNFN